jgi:hypothetical protein
MTVTPATDSAESVLKALTANGTALSKRAATLITKQGAALYESNVHLKAAQDKLDALAAEATRAATVIDAPPSSADQIALAIATERERCAKLAETIDLVPHPAQMCSMNAWEALSWGRHVAAAKIRGSALPTNGTTLPPAGSKV